MNGGKLLMECVERLDQSGRICLREGAWKSEKRVEEGNNETMWWQQAVEKVKWNMDEVELKG